MLTAANRMSKKWGYIKGRFSQKYEIKRCTIFKNKTLFTEDRRISDEKRNFSIRIGSPLVISYTYIFYIIFIYISSYHP